MRYGGFWRRVAATWIDWFVLIIPLVLIIGWPASDNEFWDIAEFVNEENVPEIYETSRLSNLIFVLLFWLYEAIMTSSKYQATVGKLCFGMIVVDQQEQRMSFAHATGRHFAKYVSSILLSIGFLMVAFTKRKQGLHDFMAKTHVLVKARAKQERESSSPDSVH